MLRTDPHPAASGPTGDRTDRLLAAIRVALVAALTALVLAIAALAYVVSFEAIRAFAIETAAFPADQDLVPVGAVDLPAVRGEVAPVEPLALRPGGDHQHRLGHVGVVAADGLPGPFEGGNQQAGGAVEGGAGGCLVHQSLALLVCGPGARGGGSPARARCDGAGPARTAQRDGQSSASRWACSRSL